ncbi:Conserved_hypothetical protein [Hexamita inflata]|uniref:Uncharacterized protein n=1 Tax=Hexamita inflata TaxID=28002 RepID=A0AA86QQQ7_9EUKA|nr:Conserved hypothetical protein [Hexamita inflata]CAI9917099.1 Conserved hypothetical protein [Hexamita inflata]CAI9964246.1 Conserved hypothetical protein [Hexamita inflata]
MQDYLQRFKMTANPKITRKTLDIEIKSRLNIIPNIQCIEYHPVYQELVAVATQQTVSLYDMRNQFQQAMHQHEVPDDLIISQIAFTFPLVHYVETTYEKARAIFQQQSLQILIRYKNKRFIHVVDFLTNKVQKISFQDIPLQLSVPQHPVQTKVDFRLPLTQEFYNQIITDDIPNQFFAVLFKNEFAVVTCKENGFAVHIKQIQVTEVSNSVPHFTFGSRNNILFILVNKVVYKYRLRVNNPMKQNEFQEKQRQKCAVVLQKTQDYEDFIKKTFQTASINAIIDEVTFVVCYDYGKQLESPGHRLLIKDEQSYIMTNNGIHVAEFDSNNQQFKQIFGFLKFAAQQKISFNYKLREEEVENAAVDDSFDIYAPESSQVLSCDEESNSTDNLNKIQAPETSGFDYFVQNSYFTVNQQVINCSKLVKNNFQLIQHLNCLYELNHETEKEIEIQNQYIDFAQQMQISNANFLLVYINPFTNVQVFDLKQLRKETKLQVLTSVTFELIRDIDLKFSRNAILCTKPEKWAEMMIWARGDQLMVMQQ